MNATTYVITGETMRITCIDRDELLTLTALPCNAAFLESIERMLSNGFVDVSDQIALNDQVVITDAYEEYTPFDQVWPQYLFAAAWRQKTILGYDRPNSPPMPDPYTLLVDVGYVDFVRVPMGLLDPVRDLANYLATLAVDGKDRDLLHVAASMLYLHGYQQKAYALWARWHAENGGDF